MNIIQTEFDFDFNENSNKVVTDEKIKRFDQSNTIKNISTDQSEILYNIMKLYNNGEAFECDMTASELKFYGDLKGASYKIPIPKILFDVYPSKDFIKKITPFQKLPLEDKSIKSIVVDLPFVISPKTAPSQSKETKRSNMIAKRFGCWYPFNYLYSGGNNSVILLLLFEQPTRVARGNLSLFASSFLVNVLFLNCCF